MASERQIAANRRNSLKSTGPKTKSGKRRAARNAVRHGLVMASLLPAEDELVESLALKICGQLPREFALGPAREAARAQVYLDQICRLKTEIINRAFLFGSLTISPRFPSIAAEGKYVRTQPLDKALVWPVRLQLRSFLALYEETRMTEAFRKSLLELRKLERYERRAFSDRGRALHAMLTAVRAPPSEIDFAKRTQFESNINGSPTG